MLGARSAKSISLVSLVQFFVLSFDRTKAIHEFTRNSTNKNDFRFVYFRGSILSGKEVFSRWDIVFIPIVLP